MSGKFTDEQMDIATELLDSLDWNIVDAIQLLTVAKSLLQTEERACEPETIG